MNIIEEAANVCNTAEKALREIMQKAISAAEYRHLPTLARMAEQIATLATRASQTADATPEEGVPVSDAAQKIMHRNRRGKAAHVANRNKRKLKTQPIVRTSKAGYPRFLRAGDNLIKVGWSKKSRTEYEHRAPRRAVEEVMKAVANVGAQGKVFTVETLIPLHDNADGTDMPTYQVYLAVAWLRTEGVIRQHGREGYSLMVAENPEKTVEERWNALPTEEQTKEAAQ